MNLSTIPKIARVDKVYHLNSEARLYLDFLQKESELSIYVKLYDEFSCEYIDISEDILLEIIKETRKFGNINIKYPSVKVAKRIHVREVFNTYLIKFGKKKIVLDYEAIKTLEKYLPDILADIRNVENKHRNKIDIETVETTEADN